MDEPDPQRSSFPPVPETKRQHDLANAGTFVASLIIWAIVGPLLVVGLGFAGASVMNKGEIGSAIGGLVGLVLLAVALRASMRLGNPQRRGAAMAGALTGIGLAALLVGGCFVWLSNLKL